VPTINLPDTLSATSAEHYFRTIWDGRPGTEMQTWSATFTEDEVLSLVDHIQSLDAPLPDKDDVKSLVGDQKRGNPLFKEHCTACHGADGAGGIANLLNPPSFLAMASDNFLWDTVAAGRKHTGMPSWRKLSASEVSDVVAHIRSFESQPPSYSQVSAIAGSTKAGAELFGAHCASCHGDGAKGGIGSRLSSNSFLSMVDNRFLYTAIVDGRPGTAMPAWSFLKGKELADLIAFLRSLQKSPPKNMSTARKTGRAEFGKVLYEASCTVCHGANGEGGFGNQIANPTFLSSASDKFMWQTIAHGKDDTAMLGFLNNGKPNSFNTLQASDIDHIIAYIRELGASWDGTLHKRAARIPNIKLGQEVYNREGSCVTCHGVHGEGTIGPSLSDPDFLNVASDGFLMGTAILGRENTLMPSFYKGGPLELSQNEVQAVASYIRSFEGQEHYQTRNKPYSPQDIAAGGELFKANCGRCHGEAGLGSKRSGIEDFAPALNNQAFLHAADDGFLWATIVLGREGALMPSFTKGKEKDVAVLSADEIKKIVAFIRSWEKE